MDDDAARHLADTTARARRCTRRARWRLAGEPAASGDQDLTALIARALTRLRHVVLLPFTMPVLLLVVAVAWDAPAWTVLFTVLALVVVVRGALVLRTVRRAGRWLAVHGRSAPLGPGAVGPGRP